MSIKTPTKTRPATTTASSKKYSLSTVSKTSGSIVVSSVFNNSPTCDCLMPNTDFMFFKSDVKPEWEDAKNRKGGKWVVTIEKQHMKEVNVQTIWEEALLSLVGCQYEDTEDINGIVLSLRERFYRFSLWVRKEETAKELIKRIGTTFRSVCKIPLSIQVVYQLHANALKKHLDNDFIMAI